MSQHSLTTPPLTRLHDGTHPLDRISEVERGLAQIEEKLDSLLGHASNGQDPAPLMKVGEVARYLNVSERTVWDLLARGVITPIRLSRGLTRVERQSVKAYLRALARGTNNSGRRTAGGGNR